MQVTAVQGLTNTGDVAGQESPRESLVIEQWFSSPPIVVELKFPIYFSGRAQALTRLYGGRASAPASRVDGQV